MASGPNSDDIGSATAPIRKMAMNATAVSSDAGLTMATTSPRPTPRPVRTFARRLACSFTSPNVYVVWVSSLATTTRAVASWSCSSTQTTPMFIRSGTSNVRKSTCCHSSS